MIHTKCCRPPVASSMSAPQSGTAWGWGKFILPFIEQQSLHDTISTGNPSLWGALSSRQAARDAAAAFGFPLPVGYCAEVNTQRTFNYYSQSLSCATSNYVGSSSSDIPLGDSPMPSTPGFFRDSNPCHLRKFLTARAIRSPSANAWQYRDNLGARQLAKSGDRLRHRQRRRQCFRRDSLGRHPGSRRLRAGPDRHLSAGHGHDRLQPGRALLFQRAWRGQFRVMRRERAVRQLDD